MSPRRARTRVAALAVLVAVATALAAAPAAGAASPAGDAWADGSIPSVDGFLKNETEGGLAIDGSLTGEDDGTVNASLDADATVAGDGVAATGDASTSVDDTGTGASVSTSGDLEAATIAVRATTADGVRLTADASIADADGDAAPAGENDSRAGPPGGTGGDGASGGLPAPEDAGAGVAVGSLVVGGGLLARRIAGTAATGGGGGSLVSTALALVRAWGWRLLAIAGYHRFDDSDPLAHETRAEICEVLRESPGAYLAEISEATDVPPSTLRYHLRILGYEDAVTSAKVRGKRRYFPAGVDPDALAPALEEEATAAVLEALAVAPDSVSGLADRLDRDPSTVSHHLQRLDEEGLVERERDGRSVVNRLAEGLDATTVAAAAARPAAGSAD